MSLLENWHNLTNAVLISKQVLLHYIQNEQSFCQIQLQKSGPFFHCLSFTFHGDEIKMSNKPC